MPRWPYSDKKWRVIRKAVLARDGFTCQLRLPGCLGIATHVDHLLEVSAGGAPFDAANLQASCRSCNIAKRNINVAKRRNYYVPPSRDW